MAPRIAAATDGEEDDRCRDLGAEDCDFGRFHGGVGLHGAAIACPAGCTGPALAFSATLGALDGEGLQAQAAAHLAQGGAAGQSTRHR